MTPLVLTCCLALGTVLALPSSGRQGPPVPRQRDLAAIHVFPKEAGDLTSPSTALSERLLALASLPKQRETTNRGSVILPPGQHLLQLPNFPEDHPINVNITVAFQGEFGQDISITCAGVDIEKGDDDSCVADWLINLENQTATYCGFGSTGGESAVTITVQFVSNGQTSNGGFSCRITVPDPNATCSCGQASRASRIVGGVETEVSEYPWQAGLYYQDDFSPFCGGSVINSRYVLTAAHCTEGKLANDIWVLLGDHDVFVPDPGEEVHRVTRIINHPEFNNTTFIYDFSLLQLDRPISFSRQIGTVCLPTPGETYDGASATASGFGRIGSQAPLSNFLQEVNQTVWSPFDCEAYVGAYYRESVTLCAGGESDKSTCYGDSGGPLATNVDGRYVIIGITSYGWDPCGGDTPDVYSRVTGVLQWITQNTADAFYCS